MSKPGWLRFIGWLALFLLIFPLTWPLAEKLSGHALPESVIPGLMWAGALPLIALWVIASVGHAIIRTTARAKAAAMKDALGRLDKPSLHNQEIAPSQGQAPGPRWGSPHHLTPPEGPK